MCIGIRSPGTGVTDSRELPCGCWELNLDPLEEQPVLLTTEPSLQSQSFVFYVGVDFVLVGLLVNWFDLGVLFCFFESCVASD